MYVIVTSGTVIDTINNSTVPVLSSRDPRLKVLYIIIIKIYGVRLYLFKIFTFYSTFSNGHWC
jgi:hypothetical protein